MTAVLAREPARRVTKELLAEDSRSHLARVIATEPGVVAASALVRPPEGEDSAGTWNLCVTEGREMRTGETLMEIRGTAWELAVAEDHAMGVLGLAGGVAKHASTIRAAAPKDLRIVCGPWKKWPVVLKPLLRAALDVAGVGHRLLEDEFVYVPKNHVRMLGGIEDAVANSVALNHGTVAVQVVSADEAVRAVRVGAGAVMVDDGGIVELCAAQYALTNAGLRDGVTLAYGGHAVPGELALIRQAGADVVDMGRAILNAPLWDLRMVVHPS